MNADFQRIDLDKYIRTKVRVLNDTGGRGFDRGVRTFSCPLCRDTKGRGWINVQFWAAGCFNVGCIAHERLTGGAVEWTRRLEGLQYRADTLIMLREEFSTSKPFEARQAKRDEGDFVRWPEGMKPIGTPTANPVYARTFERFIEKQWGLTIADAKTWGLSYCMTGRYAQRVIVPIVMYGEPVAFQGRTVTDAKPKYLTSRYGPQSDPEADCGRNAARILFNYDSVPEGGEIALVEGVGDVMGWHRKKRDIVAVGMLGLSLTPEKLALLTAKKPKRIIIAPDSEIEAKNKSWYSDVRSLFAALSDWDLPAARGEWRGGKDAGSGAELVIL